MIIAVKAAKKESHGGGRHGVVLDVCRLFRGDIGNTRRIAKTKGNAPEYTRKWRVTANIKITR